MIDPKAMSDQELRQALAQHEFDSDEYEILIKEAEVRDLDF